MAYSTEMGLRPRPLICGKMNHIQCPILAPACSSESTRLNTGSCAITKRSRLNGSWEERLVEACIQASVSLNLSTSQPLKKRPSHFHYERRTHEKEVNGCQLEDVQDSGPVSRFFPRLPSARRRTRARPDRGLPVVPRHPCGPRCGPGIERGDRRPERALEGRRSFYGGDLGRSVTRFRRSPRDHRPFGTAAIFWRD